MSTPMDMAGEGKRAGCQEIIYIMYCKSEYLFVRSIFTSKIQPISINFGIDIDEILHTYHSRFIPEAEVSQIFLRDTHV
jgi:hypothetical protein